MPPSVNKSNAKHYKAEGTITEYFEFEGRDHWTCGADGLGGVADHALDWARAPGNRGRTSEQSGTGVSPVPRNTRSATGAWRQAPRWASARV